ncbi:MAG: molybdopterin-dependent oxidoreductase [Silicimonas sp.]|nr:molybdopterin-dependent oxidoreductase [Silicimonas sp.]
MTERVSDRLRIREGKLLIRTGKVDIGQRISTALAIIAHEELTLPFDRIEVLPVTTADSPDEGVTSGSNSIEQSGGALRAAAATLRGHVLSEAAARYGGTPGDWSLAEGMLIGPGANRPVPVLDLAGTGLELTVTDDAPTRYRRDTDVVPMLGIAQMVTGEHRFVHDYEVPDMLHARIIRPPHAHARLRGIDISTSEKIEDEGLFIHRDGSFLAVAGPAEWPVVRAAQRLANACDWDPGEGLPEDDIFERLTPDRAIRLAVKNGIPDKDIAIPPPLESPDFAARYERPFTMHGALAPSAALASWDGRRLEIVTHSQGIHVLRDAVAESLGLDSRNVVLTHAPGSGCYGHNGADDAAFEAALIAISIPCTPVLLKWSREDEHAWEPYGTAGAVELAARVDQDGRLASFSAEAIGGTFRGRPRAGKDRTGARKLIANQFRKKPEGPAPAVPNMNPQGGLQRNLDPVYDIPETRYVKNLVPDLPLRTSALRCLGAALNVFAIEGFIDEIAHARGSEPLRFRKAHLGDPRALAVLDRLEELLGDRPASGGRGIAYGQYKNSMTRVAIAVDLDLDETARIRLRNATIVADAGRIIDRDGLTAQLQGGFLQAASWALHEAVTWDRDGVASRDWDSYPVLRFEDVPDIDVSLIDRPDDPSAGAGEAAPGPTLAAIGNAVFDACGLRMRRLPFRPDDLRAAALAQ